MGFNVAWLAFRGKTRKNILEAMRLADTFDADSFDESPISGFETPCGLYLIRINDCFHPLISQESLNRLSEECTLIGCQLEEHIMVSAAFLYENGKRSWNISHDFSIGLYNLETDGEVPDVFTEVSNRLISAQDAEGGEGSDVDFIFDIPIEVAASICGFRHDQSSAMPGHSGSTRLVFANG